MVEVSITNQLSELDIPDNFREYYSQSVALLRASLEEIIQQKSTNNLERFLPYFIQFYESFSSEKEVFDSLNAMRNNSDPIYSHSINVALLARMLADINHIDRDDLDALTLGALLHDIGKMTIPTDILCKKDTLTHREYHIIQKHTKDGYNLLHPLFPDNRISSVALMHHERCDGTGYPMGTTGETINEFSRIVAICDVYAGMIAEREYRNSLCPFEVIRLFEKEGLQRFDTDYTLLFLRSMLDTYVGYRVTLNTHEEGVITAVNSHQLSSPIISINGKIVNLALDPKRRILHIL